MISENRQSVFAYASSLAIAATVAADLTHLLLNSKPFREETVFRPVGYAVGATVIAAAIVACVAWRRRTLTLPLRSTAVGLSAAFLTFVLGVRFAHPFSTYPATTQLANGGVTLSQNLTLRRAAGEFISHLTFLASIALLVAGVAAVAIAAYSRRLTDR